MIRLTIFASLATFGTILLWPVSSPETVDPASVSSAPASATLRCVVTGVHDGDGPIYCASGEKIRLTAIAARELDETCNPGHPCPSASGASARDELRSLALGQTLSCEATGTSYGRITAWCWRADGAELNCAMLRSGKASYWAKFDRAGRMCGGRI